MARALPRAAALGAAVAALAACSDDPLSVAAPRPAVAVAVVAHDSAPAPALSIAPRPVTLVAGDSIALSATLRDARDSVVAAGPLHWSSADTTVAAIDSASGALAARGAGTALITARGEAGSDTLTVTVVPAVTALHIALPVDTLEAYEVRGARAYFADSAGRAITHGAAVAGRAVRWASSDTAVARIDSATGALTGVDRGTVTITATSGDLSATATRVVVIRYRSITAGSDHACNLASGGIAWCWGRNGRQGMIGLEKLDEYEVSTVPVKIPGGHRFTTIETYGTTTCGIDLDAKAWCWGYNGWGSLGIGTSSPGQSPTPRAVAGGHRFKSLAAGESQVCGVTLADKVYCWGYGQYYQFGNGNGRGSEAPVLSASDSTLVHVAMGGDAGCGLDRLGAAFCWGWNGAGQDGGGQKPSNGNTYTKVPTPVVGGLTFRSLSLSESYACGVDVNDKGYCWGASRFVGSRVTNNVSTPTPIALDQPVRTISAGKEHACALTTSDEIWCWGGNGNGQLGAGPYNGSAVPIRSAGDLKASEISAATLSVGFAAFTCAISVDRLTTYCWGRGDFGQLGNGTKVEKDVVNNTPTIVVGQKPAPVEKE